MKFKSLLTLAEVVLLIVAATTSLLLLSVHEYWIAVPTLVVCGARVVHRLYKAKRMMAGFVLRLRTDRRARWICIVVAVGILAMTFIPNGLLFAMGTIIGLSVWISRSPNDRVDLEDVDSQPERTSGTYDYLPDNVFHKGADSQTNENVL